VIVSLQELELLSKNLRAHQISIEKRLASGIVGRNQAVVVHDRAAAEWRDPVEPSDVMQSWIYSVLQ